MKASSRKAKHQEYATKLTLTGVFLAIFMAFVSKMTFWQPNRKEYKISPFDLVMLALATLRLGRMVAYDHIAEPLRQPFAKTVPDQTGAGDTVTPKEDSGMQRSLGQLISCPICTGTWISAGLVYGLHMFPNATRVFLAIMGTTGLTEILNALTEALSWSGQLARTLAGEKAPFS